MSWLILLLKIPVMAALHAPIEIDPKLTYTKSAYARAFGLNLKALARLIKDREVKTIEVRGTTLVIAKQA